ncbi:Xanthine dehydrogenase C subunit [Parasponia andersonii]|uniref:Xanthine dehydrogenase C subunit n=1 Tax=Parasponia andersonii TaxID=3476 RepID=A0A2P5APH7_PARAD|nr:Xanthine dehydrogenase C subunit [Parasponia andersonii]
MKSTATLLFLCSFSLAVLADHQTDHEDYLQCLSHHFSNTTSNPELIYTPNDMSYFSVLNSSIKNPRFFTSLNPKPILIVTPLEASHVQATIICSKKHDIQIRTRSGGHDFEGLSYVSELGPFVIIDLIKLSSITVNVDEKTAWVQAGATIGEVYYRIYEKSENLGFPAGFCPTVGVGGHFSGGGYGPLMRKYGIAADNVIDAYLVNVDGRILDRESMGEDLFWAIRGGGAASFGVVLAWKIRLVPVPSTVTVFNVRKNLEQEENKKLVLRWQYAAEKFPEDLLIFVRLITANSTEGAGNNSNERVEPQAWFFSLYLGGVDKLLDLMQNIFPEFGLKREDCTEMKWVESFLFFNGFPNGSSPEALLNRTSQSQLLPFKSKSDYVKVPISEKVLDGIFEKLYEEEVGRAWIQWYPYGAKMNEIPESEIPFPHRAGNIYSVIYFLEWEEDGDIATTEGHLNWIRRAYNYMTPYVTKNPRASYVNYRDLDLGRNNFKGPTSYAQASIWGTKYFKKNFNRLVRVKTKVDPTNFFRNEQSIPPLPTQQKKRGD